MTPRKGDTMQCSPLSSWFILEHNLDDHGPGFALGGAGIRAQGGVAAGCGVAGPASKPVKRLRMESLRPIWAIKHLRIRCRDPG